MGVGCNASPPPSQLFRTLSVSPDTHNTGRELRYGVSCDCLVRICVLLNTDTAGLRALRTPGNRSRLFLQAVPNLDPPMFPQAQSASLLLHAGLALVKAV